MPLDIVKMKTLREKIGLSMEEAANSGGLAGRQHWQKVESGQIPNIGLETLEGIATALGVKVSDLLKVGREKKPEGDSEVLANLLNDLPDEHERGRYLEEELGWNTARIVRAGEELTRKGTPVTMQLNLLKGHAHVTCVCKGNQCSDS